MKKCKWILITMIIVVVACFCLGCKTSDEKDNGSNTNTGTLDDIVHDGTTK